MEVPHLLAGTAATGAQAHADKAVDVAISQVPKHRYQP